MARTLSLSFLLSLSLSLTSLFYSIFFIRMKCSHCLFLHPLWSFIFSVQTKFKFNDEIMWYMFNKLKFNISVRKNSEQQSFFNSNRKKWLIVFIIQKKFYSFQSKDFARVWIFVVVVLLIFWLLVSLVSKTS